MQVFFFSFFLFFFSPGLFSTLFICFSAVSATCTCTCACTCRDGVKVASIQSQHTRPTCAYNTTLYIYEPLPRHVSLHKLNTRTQACTRALCARLMLARIGSYAASTTPGAQQYHGLATSESGWRKYFAQAWSLC
ncbi:hypothetical protein J3E69DRAFT_348117 [Trichoderma sp. SZMC 28015]